MKKGILILFGLALGLVLVFSFVSRSGPETLSGNVKTGGSTSVEKVMNSLIYQFQFLNRDVRIDYEMNGSGDGIKSTLSGLYEIGHSSRDLKTDGSETGLKAIPYAIDGIAIIVNKENPVTNITQQQLLDIYTGKITNWKEVGGKDALITVISREPGSGTRSAFSEIVGLEQKNNSETGIVATATIADSNGAIQTTVMQNPNSIGYMSFSDVDTNKVNTISYNGVEITLNTLRSDTYKLKRTFLMVVKEYTPLSKASQAFIDFVLSEEGQEIVAQNKLIPVK